MPGLAPDDWSTRELMHRTGHGSMRAALIYQDTTSERDQEIAAALHAWIEREAVEKAAESRPSTIPTPVRCRRSRSSNSLAAKSAPCPTLEPAHLPHDNDKS